MIAIHGAGIHRYPVELRFAYPSELDLTARIAGMQSRALGRWIGSVQLRERESCLGLPADVLRRW